jgi:cystathionine gamma-synthase
MAAAEIGREGESVWLFATKGAANRAQRWIEKRWGGAARAVSFEGFQAIVLPAAAAPLAKDYQRFTGELISSRQAEDWLSGKVKSGSKEHLLKRRLAGIYQTKAEMISIFSSGMSAITAVMRALPGVAAGKKTLQLEFPYVDALKVQEHFGNGVVFLNECEGESFDIALQRIGSGEFAAVFTEVPSNPLLRCADIPAVAEACRKGGTPLVIDDSSAGPFNVRALAFADVVTCSLTKWLSGEGDVMGGMAVVREDSAFSGDFCPALARESAETAPLYVGDAQVMLENLKGFPARMARPNESGSKLAAYLADHPAVDQVWHPSLTNTQRYREIMAPGGGFGGLLSFTLRQPKKVAKVFDALKISKGPSFGTPFTLGCPYVMLAHYHERDWAAGCGVPDHLLRISCGQEDYPLIESIFAEALPSA